MFATRPDFEEFVPKSLVPKGTQIWGAVALTNHFPWFVLTHRIGEASEIRLQALAIATEQILMAIIASKPVDFVVALNWATPIPGRLGEWQMRPVAELWRPTSDEQNDGALMLIRLRGGPVLYGSLDYKVFSEREGRQLLLRVASDVQH